MIPMRQPEQKNFSLSYDFTSEEVAALARFEIILLMPSAVAKYGALERNSSLLVGMPISLTMAT